MKEFEMRIAIVLIGLLVSVMSAKADQVVLSGRTLQLYYNYSINPDCTPTGDVVMRVAEPPEHGTVTIRHSRVFPSFTEANPRSACNRRRVPAVMATYVSQRGYVGSDYVVLEVFFPNGRALRVRLPIQVK